MEGFTYEMFLVVPVIASAELIYGRVNNTKRISKYKQTDFVECFGTRITREL